MPKYLPRLKKNNPQTVIREVRGNRGEKQYCQNKPSFQGETFTLAKAIKCFGSHSFTPGIREHAYTRDHQHTSYTPTHHVKEAREDFPARKKEKKIDLKI